MNGYFRDPRRLPDNAMNLALLGTTLAEFGPFVTLACPWPIAGIECCVKVGLNHLPPEGTVQSGLPSISAAPRSLASGFAATIRRLSELQLQ